MIVGAPSTKMVTHGQTRGRGSGNQKPADGRRGRTWLERRRRHKGIRGRMFVVWWRPLHLTKSPALWTLGYALFPNANVFPATICCYGCLLVLVFVLFSCLFNCCVACVFNVFNDAFKLLENKPCRIIVELCNKVIVLCVIPQV